LFGPGIFCPYGMVSPKGYFQQEVNHKISVKLNDKKHELDGYESIEYINNSPDTMGFLYIHLWPNAYSENNTELAKEIFRNFGKSKLFKDPELRGYIDSLDFKIDGLRAEWIMVPGFPDICKLFLNEPVTPGDTIFIETPFHVKIPGGESSRLGHIGESYQISQWYPKPAVYDRNGWHQMPYLDEGEFYSEFGSYNVSITLPANYVVGATGNLENRDELDFLDLLAADTSWQKSIKQESEDFPISETRLKTLRYSENNIHDFAWFADKRFHVLKGKVKLPDSGREITTWTMFTDQESKVWMNSTSFIDSAIIYFSELNGDYPYGTFTVVQSVLNSGAGMEYPGLTVLGLVKNSYFLDEVLAHEISHNWFYSAIGSDERRFPYMDESIASAYESRYMEIRYPLKKLWEVNLYNRKLARFFRIKQLPAERLTEFEWIVPARKNLEQPVNLASDQFSYKNYGSILYYKAAQGFNYLRYYLGDSLFDSIMHDYYRLWKNRHPEPDDLRKVFESATTKDLSWFFDDFLETTKRLDYKLIRLDDRKLLIKNTGELKSPLLISVMQGDSIVSESWENGFEGMKFINIPAGDFSEIKIDPGHRMTELYRLNNNIRRSGLFRKSDPLQVQFLFTIEDPDKRYLEYLPAFDWNTIDGFMLGLALHNGSLLPKPVEYFIMPFYTFRKRVLTGYGKVSYNIVPYNSFVRIATLSAEGSQFGAPADQNYHKLKIGLDLSFRFQRFASLINQKLYCYFISASDLHQIESLIRAKGVSYQQVGYIIERYGIINPFALNVCLEAGRSYQKTALELNYRYSYYGKNNGLDVRIYSGIMLHNHSTDPFYAFSSGGRSGPDLYLYQGVFPGRFSSYLTTFWSRQMTLSEGGLVSYVNDSLGYSKWTCSLSLTSSLPGIASKIPVKPFYNAVVSSFNGSHTYKPMLFYEAGFKTGIWDFFEVYCPLVVSGNLHGITGSFKERIRFVFSVDKLFVSKFKF